MPELVALLRAEPDAGVRAVLGHFMFVYIHPYMDGNGRMGRFLMNLMLASGGYPWTVVPVSGATITEGARSRERRSERTTFSEFLGRLVKDRQKTVGKKARR